jgi:hypothetical protein
MKKDQLERLALEERKQRALAMSCLLARASRECSYVIDRDVDDAVRNGLWHIESSHMEDLAELLGLVSR